MLKITGLNKSYPSRVRGMGRRAETPILKNVNFEVKEGETHALVGESGSGKSTLAQCVLGLTRVTGGEIQFLDFDLVRGSKKDFKKLRKDMQPVFQDPYSSLNARMKIKHIIAEPLLVHEPQLSGKQRMQRVTEVVRRVHLHESLLNRFPHSLSGGQRQRVNIARALIIRPKLIVCDEILSALDVSVQAKVIRLLKDIQRTENVSYLFITHDFGVVRQMAHRVSVLSKGSIVETGLMEKVLDTPQHPYTQLLLSAVPGQGLDALQETRLRLRAFRMHEASVQEAG